MSEQSIILLSELPALRSSLRTEIYHQLKSKKHYGEALTPAHKYSTNKMYRCSKKIFTVTLQTQLKQMLFLKELHVSEMGETPGNAE